MRLTVPQLIAASDRDPYAVPRLARFLGLRGDAPIFVVAGRANDPSYDASYWGRYP